MRETDKESRVSAKYEYMASSCGARHGFPAINRMKGASERRQEGGFSGRRRVKQEEEEEEPRPHHLLPVCGSLARLLVSENIFRKKIYNPTCSMTSSM